MRPGEGSMAALAAVPRRDIVALPAGVDPALVAALELSAVAAHMALTWRGELAPGERVLVPLDDIAAAWTRQAAGVASGRIVLTP
jgi:NADPH:quinone reductase-like Zn-dependent oxidoreductase